MSRALALLVLLGSLDAAADPLLDYTMECRGCHLGDGRGAPGAVPSLRELAWLLEVPGGRAYLIGVPGVAQSQLDDARLAALLNWVIRSFSPPDPAAAFVPFSADEVAGQRRPPLSDPASVRRALLARRDEARPAD